MPPRSHRPAAGRSPVTMLDRALSLVAPRAALHRVQARWALQQVDLLARGYDAGRVNRRTDGWVTPSTSANAEIGPVIQRIRDRSRDAVRNNPLATRAVRKLTTAIVGTGLTPSPQLEDATARQQVREDWRSFHEQCDPEGLRSFGGIQKEIIRCVIESGEALVHLIPAPSSAGLRVPLQLRVLEPDVVDHTRTQSLPGGGAIIQGVEYDARGRRVAYWMWDHHPGDSLVVGRQRVTRVDAQWILPVLDILRPGQIHGVPWFAPVLMKLRDVDDLDDARLVKKKIEACFAAFVRKVDPDSPVTSPRTDPQTGRRLESLAPGAVYYLGPDEDITFANPSSSEGDTDYLIMQLHVIAAGLGLPYHGLTGDLRQANYSSLRAGNLDLWSFVDDWQANMLVQQVCGPVWRRVDALLVALGRRPVSVASDWVAPERPLVDPLKDGQAIRADLRMGRRTLPEAVRARGRDWDAHVTEIATANQDIDRAGLVLDSDARKTSAAGLTQARNPGTVLPSPGINDGDSDDGV